MGTLKACLAVVKDFTAEDFEALEAKAKDYAKGKPLTNDHFIKAAKDTIATLKDDVKAIESNVEPEAAPPKEEPKAEKVDTSAERVQETPKTEQVENQDLTENTPEPPNERKARAKKVRDRAAKAFDDGKIDLEDEATVVNLLDQDDVDGAEEALKAAASPNSRTAEERDAVGAKVTLGPVVRQLTKAQQAKLQTHYNAPMTTGRFWTQLANDVNRYVNAGAEAVSGAIRSIIKKVAEGVLAVGIVLNPQAFNNNFAFDLPATYQKTVQVGERQVLATVPANAEAKMSETAKGVYRSMAPVAMESGKGFIIADKPTGMIHLFNADGSMLDQAPALYGKDVGDTLGKSSLEGGPKITPSGKYTLEFNRDSGYTGGATFRLVETEDNTGFVAIHAVYVGDPKENRLKKLSSANPNDKRASYGCINTTNDTFLKKLLPNTAKFDGGMVFVLPDSGVRMGQFTPKTEPVFGKATERTSAARGMDTGDQQPGMGDRRNQQARSTSAARRRNDDSRFRNPEAKEPPSKPIESSVLDALVAKANKILGGSQIVVRDDVADVFPEEKPGSRAGALDNGVVYLFRSGIPNGLEGQKTILHELFHKGLRNLLPKGEYFRTLNRMYDQSQELRSLANKWMDDNKADVKREIDQYESEADKSAAARALAMDEVLADKAESLDTLNPGTLRQIGNWMADIADKLGMTQLAQWLRSAGRSPLENFLQEALRASSQGTTQGTTFRPGTTAFQKWFGDSKVVDKDGNPLVVYHGTAADFSTFEGNRFYFTPNPEYAGNYADETPGANVMPVYLSLQNPLDLSSLGAGRLSEQTVLNAMAAKGVDVSGLRGVVKSKNKEIGVWAWWHSPEVRAAVQAAGFDSAIQREKTGAGESLAYIAFKPTQIKSATGNNGEYDPTNPDIRFRTATETLAAIGNNLRYDKLGMARRGLLASTFLRDIGNRYEKQFSRVKEYVDKVFEMAATSGKYLESANKVNDAYNSLSASELKAVMELQADATSNRVVADREDKSRKNDHMTTDEEKATVKAIQDRFDALSDKAKAVYRQSRDVMRTNWEKRGSLLARAADDVYNPLIQAAESAGNEKQVKALKREKNAFIEDINARLNDIKGDYFPMERFGDYTVVRKSAEFTAMQDAANKAFADLEALLDKYEGDPETRAVVRDVNKVLKAKGDPLLSEFTPEQAAEIKAAREAYREAQKKLDTAKADPDQYYVAFFETESEARQHAKQAGGVPLKRQQYQRELNPITRSILSKLEESMAANLRGQGSETALREAKRAMYSVYLRSLPELSALKRQAKRKYVAGFERNMQRAVASTLSRDAFYLSRLEHMDDITASLNSVREEAEAKQDIELQEVADELEKRHAATMRYVDTPVQDKLSAFTYAMMLGISPGFLIANMTQPFMVSAPVMAARHGVSKVTGQMGKAYADVARMVTESIKGNWSGEINFDIPGIAADEKRMLEAMLRQQLLTVSLTQDITNVAKGLDTGSYWSIGKKVMALPAHHAEVINRISTALAAYRMERTVKSSDEATATKYAQKVLADTHFDYSAENAPYWMKPGVTPLGKLVFQFKKYQAAMISLYIKTSAAALKGESKAVRDEAKRALLGMTATHLAVAGAVGLPIYFPVKLAAEMIVGAFGDDEEPYDFDTWLRNSLYDMTGSQAAATAMAKGLPTLLGMDLSGKVGAGNLLNPMPLLRDNKSGADLYKEMLASIAGPFFGGMLPRYADGMAYLANGDFVRAAESFSPKFLADAIRAGRFATEGVETRKGLTMVGRDELSGWDVLLQASGVPAVELTDRYEARSAVENTKRFYSERATAAKREWLDAKKAGDDERVAEVRQKIEKEINPARKKAGLPPITVSDLLQYQQGVKKQEADYAKYGATVGKNVKLGEEARFAQ
jgi:hypothetical protein